MQFDFKSEMVKRTDEELIKILTIDKENYLPEAIAAAEDEFKKRNILEERVISTFDHLTKEKEIEVNKANEPLDFGIKLATFLIPILFTLILSGYYKAGGYDRKARELATWTLYGFIAYAVVIFIALLV